MPRVPTKPTTTGPDSGAAQTGRITPAQLMDHLREAPPPEAILVGMVKPSDDDPKALMFAHVGDCSHWVRISCDLIDSVEKLQVVSCGGQQYQVVRLFMKSPQTDEARTFADLAHLHRTKLAEAQASLSLSSAVPAVTGGPCIPVPPSGICPAGMHLTRNLQPDGTGTWVCCPD